MGSRSLFIAVSEAFFLKIYGILSQNNIKLDNQRIFKVEKSAFCGGTYEEV